MSLLKFSVILLIFLHRSIKSDDFAYEKHFGTKTPYRVVANLNDSKVEFPGCTPEKIWYVVRHGTRTPTEHALKGMNDHLPNVLKQIVKANEHNVNVDVETLKKWKLEYKETVLTVEGEKELQSLARRMQRRFPALFPETYTNDTYHFRSTNSQRTIASTKHFALGLFGIEHLKNVYIDIDPAVDPILRYYRICTRWMQEVAKKPAVEQVKFHKSELMKHQIYELSKKLNLTSNLTVDEVQSMYQACCIDVANKNESVWCQLLSVDLIKMMEFSQTLAYDHKTGYANEISYKQACPLLQHIVKYFDDKSSKIRALVMFTHDTVILTFLSLLGLFKNEKKMEHTDFNSDFNNNWKLSEIATFASNIAFILFRCSDEEMVVMIHQERLIQLPKCGKLCGFNVFKEYYYEHIYNCKFKELCNV